MFVAKQYYFYRIEGVLKQINLDQIVFLEVEDNYTRFFVNSSEYHLVRTTLDATMKLLPASFLRIHRKYAVSGNFLLMMDRETVVLGPDSVTVVAELPVSKQYYAALTKQFVIFDSSPARSKNQQS